jgi:hypothetical protein
VTGRYVAVEEGVLITFGELRRIAAVEDPKFTRHAILPTSDLAGKAAREVVHRMCDRWGLDHLDETASACASELAANTARHVRWDEVAVGRRVAWLVMSMWDAVLLVEVRDPDLRFPVVGSGIDWAAIDGHGANMGLLPQSGLGLFLVARMVDEAGGQFGMMALPDGGKSVYFLLPTDRAVGRDIS